MLEVSQNKVICKKAFSKGWYKESSANQLGANRAYLKRSDHHRAAVQYTHGCSVF